MTVPDQAVMEAIAARMRLRRKLAGLTQNQVADHLGVTERSYARWERVENGGFLQVLEKIAAVLHTSVDELTSVGVDVGEPPDVLDRILAELIAIRELLERANEAGDAPAR